MMDDVLTFADEPMPTSDANAGTWKILIADDEPSVHLVTKLALGDFRFEGRKLTLLSAYGEEDTRRLLKEHLDIALILLDVVMDTVDSGFALVRYIRDTLKNKDLRIIMRTGQSGNAPEDRIIIDYDINDFKDKTELTVAKLRTTMISSLRTYSHLQIIAAEQQKAQASRAYLHTIINSLSSVVLTVTEQGLVLLWNREAERWTGVLADEASGRNLFEVAPVFAPLRVLLNDVLHSPRGKVERTAVPLWKGEQLFVHLILQVIEGSQDKEILFRLDDRTVAKHLDDHLLRSQKVNAFRSMATGIARELRQILGESPSIRLKDWGSKAEGLLNRLARFSPADPVIRQPLDWAIVVQDRTDALSHPDTVTLKVTLEGAQSLVWAAEEGLQAIVDNLLENAVTALDQVKDDEPHRRSRVIEVHLGPYQLTDTDVQTHPDLPDVPFWCLTVVDHGVGMSAATSQQVLEPSFSTKARGLGLGLPLVYSIVESLGGFVSFDSKPGSGTRASVFLPSWSEISLPDSPEHTTILVCDDEPLMRQIAGRILRSLGYSVIEAADGQSALDLLEAEGPGIQLVLLDLVLPGPIGVQPLEAIRKRHPKLPVIVTSSLSEPPSMADGLVISLSKPYQAQALAEAVQSSLKIAGA